MIRFISLSLFLSFSGLVYAFGYEYDYSLPDGNYECTIYPKGEQFEKYRVEFNFTVKNNEVLCKKLWDESDPEMGCETHFDMTKYNEELSENYKRNEKLSPEKRVLMPLFFIDSSDGSVGSDENGNFVVGVDSDGVETGEMVLYKNSDFLKGWIFSRFSGGGFQDGEYFGKILCNRGELK